MSFVTGAAAWYAMIAFGGFAHQGIIGIESVFFLLAVLVSACFYRLAQRPGMWMHIPLSLAPMVVYVIIAAILGSNLWVLFIVLHIAVVGVMITMVPCLPVCLIYAILYAKRFTPSTDENKPADELPGGYHGGKQDEIP